MYTPLATLLLRLPPLIHIFWIHPPLVWPSTSLILIGLQLNATGAGLGWLAQCVTLRQWQIMEGLHLVGWIIIKSLDPDAALPAGGLLHTTMVMIAACLIPSTQGTRRA